MTGEGQYIDMLKDILDKQIDTLEDILEVTKEQSRIAYGDEFDSEGFDSTLTKKDMLIIRLNEMDDGFASVYNKVRRDVRNEPDKYRDKIVVLQDMIRKCTDLGMEIKTLESRNKDKLAQCFSGKKQEYSAKQAAANVANKYSVTMRNVNLMSESYRFNKDN